MLSPYKRISILAIIIFLFAYTLYIDDSQDDESNNQNVVSITHNVDADRQTVAMENHAEDNIEASEQNEKISIANSIHNQNERINVAQPILVEKQNEKINVAQPILVKKQNENPVLENTNKKTDSEIAQTDSSIQNDLEFYTVKFNDSLWMISKKCYDFSSNKDIQKGVFAIAEANKHIKNINQLIVNQKLQIPRGKDFDTNYQNYVSYLRMRRIVVVQLPIHHVVQYGETVFSIAKKYYDDSSKWFKISKANPNANSNKLDEGITLYIPK